MVILSEICWSMYCLDVIMFHTLLFACITIQKYLPVLLPHDC